MKKLVFIVIIATGTTAVFSGLLLYFLCGESLTATCLFCGGGMLIGTAFALDALITLRTADSRRKSEGLNFQRIRYLKKMAQRQLAISSAAVIICAALLIINLIMM